MANGLCNAGSTLWEIIDQVVGCDLEPKCFQYMDDFIIATDGFDEHLEIINDVVTRLNNAGFTISMEKSKFCRDRINFLGYIITESGVKSDSEKIQTIIDYPVPKTLKKIRQFIGMIGWHDQFIKHYSTLLSPIIDLLKGGVTVPKWIPEANIAFNKIKSALI